MTPEEYYDQTVQLLTLIQEGVDRVNLLGNALLILFCAYLLYSIFWGRKL